MPDIVRINQGVTFSERKTSKKLSFEKGEVFSATIVGKADENGEVVLKLSDGWQFPAKVDENSEALQDQSSHFQVVGFEDGKIKIKAIPSGIQQNDDWESSIEELIKSSGMGLSKEDINMLKSMIKHDIPLVKENISEIKSLLFVKDRLNIDDGYSNHLIERYLSSKNILPDSAEGREVIQKLEKFFNQLKSLDINDLLTLFENSIPLNGDNLENFNKVIKGDKTIYSEIKSLEESLYNEEIKNSNINEILSSSIDDEASKLINDFSINDSDENKQVVKDIKNLKESLNIQNFDDNKLREILSNAPKVNEAIGNSVLNEEKVLSLLNEIKDSPIEVILLNNLDKDNNLFDENTAKILNSVNEAVKNISNEENGTIDDSKNSVTNNVSFLKEIFRNTDTTPKQLIDSFTNSKNLMQNIIENIYSPELEIKLVEVLADIQEAPAKAIQELNSNVNLNKILTSLKEHILELRSEKPLAENVKGEISLKLDDMKNIVKTLIEQDGVNTQDIINMYKDSFKDFKVYNDLSNKYYMLDIPVNINQDTYECKLLIKDERKSGKAIDSKNVKIVASVKTIYMGQVDSYISVNEKNIRVNIKSDEKYVSLLSKYKNNISKSLIELGYYPSIDVSKKINDANIVTAREFFDDNRHVGINIKV